MVDFESDQATTIHYPSLQYPSKYAGFTIDRVGSDRVKSSVYGTYLEPPMPPNREQAIHALAKLNNERTILVFILAWKIESPVLNLVRWQRVLLS